MAPVITHALSRLHANEGHTPEWVVLVQPTSPLRTSEDIDQAMLELEEASADGLVSVVEIDSVVYKVLVLDEHERLRGMANDEAPFLRRQDCPRVFRANGAIYIFRSADLAAAGQIPLRNAIPYVMSQDASIDIDSEHDLELAKRILGDG